MLDESQDLYLANIFVKSLLLSAYAVQQFSITKLNGSFFKIFENNFGFKNSEIFDEKIMHEED